MLICGHTAAPSSVLQMPFTSGPTPNKNQGLF